jgi:hypothetical protein
MVQAVCAPGHITPGRNTEIAEWRKDHGGYSMLIIKTQVSFWPCIHFAEYLQTQQYLCDLHAPFVPSVLKRRPGDMRFICLKRPLAPGYVPLRGDLLQPFFEIGSI